MAYCVVFVTAKDMTQAKKLAKALLTKKIVACVNMIKGVESMYTWEGKLESGREVLMIIKTKKSHFQKLVSTVKSLHSYSTPEIIAMPIIAGEKNYLNWLNSSIDS